MTNLTRLIFICLTLLLAPLSWAEEAVATPVPSNAALDTGVTVTAMQNDRGAAGSAPQARLAQGQVFRRSP